MRAVGSQGVGDVDWPAELRVFKTADTTHYVVATASSALACATCGEAFGVGDRRSLTVEVRIPDPPPPVPGFRYRQFAAEVHHRSCQPPRLEVVTTTVDEDGSGPFLGESDMHYVLVPPSRGDSEGEGDGDGLPALVFTTRDPIVVRDLEQAEGRSAWISTYLELGFDLVSVADVGWFRSHVRVTTAVEGALDGALFTLTGTIDGRAVALLEWTHNPHHPAYQAWHRAVDRSGALLVVYGEYVHVDPQSGTVDLAPGGRLGDIAAAIVWVDVVPPAPGSGA